MYISYSSSSNVDMSTFPARFLMKNPMSGSFRLLFVFYMYLLFYVLFLGSIQLYGTWKKVRRKEIVKGLQREYITFSSNAIIYLWIPLSAEARKEELAFLL